VAKEAKSLAVFDESGEYFVVSSLGIRIRILAIGWKLISEIKHPDLEGKLISVFETLKKPDVVLISDQSKEIFLYHKKFRDKYLRVVCRHYNKEGFLITAHYIKKPKGGKKYVKN